MNVKYFKILQVYKILELIDQLLTATLLCHLTQTLLTDHS